MRLPDDLEFAPKGAAITGWSPRGPKSGNVTLLYLNVGNKNRALLENSVKSARECGFEGKIIVYDDNPSSSRSVDMHKKYKVEFFDLDSSSQAGIAGSQSFGDAQFKKITYLKWSLIQIELQKLRSDKEVLVFSDADIVFLGPFWEFFLQSAQYWRIGIQSESRAKFPPSLCIGLMYFTRDSLELVGHFERITASNQGRGTAQQVLNEIVLANPTLAVGIHSLPEAVFPVGLSYSLVAGKSHPMQVHTPEILAFHANWVNGHDAKIQMLKDLGWWKVQ